MAMLNNQMDSDGFRWIQMIGPQPPPTHIARRGHKIINWIDPTDKVVFWAPRTEALERKHWTRGWKSMRLTAVHWAVHWDYRVHCKNLQALQMAMPSAWAMLFIWDQLPSEWFQTSCGRGQKHWCLYTYIHACMHACILAWTSGEREPLPNIPCGFSRFFSNSAIFNTTWDDSFCCHVAGWSLQKPMEHFRLKLSTAECSLAFRDFASKVSFVADVPLGRWWLQLQNKDNAWPWGPWAASRLSWA